MGQRLDLTNWHDEVSFVAWTVDLMSALSFFLGAVLLQVIGVGIMIVMWISIRERTREIGTLRAIGMQRTSVLLMFLTEGFLLGLLATLGGAVLGRGAVAGAQRLARAAAGGRPVRAAVGQAGGAAHACSGCWRRWRFITGVVTLISVIPSFIAARLKPVSAMQHAG